MENNWILYSLNIHKDYSSQNSYTGTVNFQDGNKIEIKLLLDEKDAQAFVNIVADKIRESANKFAETILKSLPTSLPEHKEENI